MRFHCRKLGLGPVLVALVLSLAVGSAAHADAALEAAKLHYKQASQFYDLQEYGKALEEFKLAYEAKDDPVFLYNIAQCQRVLGQREAALRSYRTYLLRAPKASNRADVEARIAALESDLAAHPEVATTTPPTTTPPTTTPPTTTTPPPEVTPPPTTTTTLEPATTPPTEVIVSAPPPRKPIYKRWYLWTPIAIVVAAGIGVGLGLGLTASHGQPVAPLVSF
jgi:cell division septation protein DedD